MNKKTLRIVVGITAIIFGWLVFFTPTTHGATILQPFQGGTGLGSALVGDVGDCLVVADDSPFRFEFDTCGGAGGGDVTKVGTPVNNQVGVWTGDGTLEGDAALTYDATTDTLTSVTFAGALTGNASTATALASNPTDCASNTFANAIAASGNLTCGSIGDADVPNNITIDLATVATTGTVSDAGGDTTTFPLLGIDATGSLGSRTDAGLSYNATTNVLTATTFVGGLTGNSDTTTALLNARTIGGVSFNGTANITVASATGNFSISNGATTAGVLTLLEDTDAGSNFASFQVPALSADTVYILPPDDGDSGEVLQTNGSGTLTWEAASASVLWNAIGDASGDGTVAFGGTTQIITGNTNDVTAIGQDLLSLSYTNDAATDILVQRGLFIQNEASANGMEALISLNNNDADDVVTSGLIITSEAGAITTALDVSDAEIVTALSIGSNTITTGATTISSAELDRLDGLAGTIVTTSAGTAPLATALAADPADCATSTHFAVGIIASGVATCEAIADADVPNTITIDLATLASTVTVVDGTDATSFIGIYDSATGSLAPKTDGALLYDALNGTLTTTTFVGALTGTASGNLVSGGALGTPSSGTVTNLTGTASININGTVGATTPTTVVGTTITANTRFAADADDGSVLGAAGTAFSDLFLAETGVINWDSGDLTLTQSGDTLTVAGGDLLVTTAGTASTSVVTISGTQTLTNKTLTSPTLTTPSAFTTGGVITLAENTSVALDPAGSADGKYSGTTVTGTGGATIAFGDLVTLDKDDSRWELVDISVAAAATGDARGIIGIAVTSSTDGGAITVLLNGIIRADANFPALTIGAPVYASTTGDIVVTQPTTTDHVIRVIGFPLTADEIYFNPSNDYITHT